MSTEYDLSAGTSGSSVAENKAPSFDLVLVLNWFAELQARVPTGR